MADQVHRSSPSCSTSRCRALIDLLETPNSVEMDHQNGVKERISSSSSYYGDLLTCQSGAAFAAAGVIAAALCDDKMDYTNSSSSSSSPNFPSPSTSSASSSSSVRKQQHKLARSRAAADLIGVTLTSASLSSEPKVQPSSTQQSTECSKQPNASSYFDSYISENLLRELNSSSPTNSDGEEVEERKSTTEQQQIGQSKAQSEKPNIASNNSMTAQSSSELNEPTSKTPKSVLSHSVKHISPTEVVNQMITKEMRAYSEEKRPQLNQTSKHIKNLLASSNDQISYPLKASFSKKQESMELKPESNKAASSEKSGNIMNLIDDIVSNEFDVNNENVIKLPEQKQEIVRPTKSSILSESNPNTIKIPNIEIPSTSPKVSNCKNSAIIELLESDHSVDLIPQDNSQSSSSSSSEPSTSKPYCSPPQKKEIPDKVYQQLIEFEFNYESILKKFRPKPSEDSAKSSGYQKCSNLKSLNPAESARIDELESVLKPLQFCLSSLSEAKPKCSFSDEAASSSSSMDTQRQYLLSTMEQALNQLIQFTKKLESFSALNQVDQMKLLQSSVMEMMLLRSIIIKPKRYVQKRKTKCGLKRFLDQIDEENQSQTLTTKIELVQEDAHDESEEPKLEPCSSHEFSLEFISVNSPSGRINLSGQMDKSQLAEEEAKAADYAKQFCSLYGKLARSINKDWYEDKTIFYLLFAILLFRPTSSAQIVDMEKVREEQITYVYLLKRYLECKFKSYCTARSHFIRIFDRLEELQNINDEVIVKLLNFDFGYAETILNKLCTC